MRGLRARPAARVDPSSNAPDPSSRRGASITWTADGVGQVGAESTEAPASSVVAGQPPRSPRSTLSLTSRDGPTRTSTSATRRDAVSLRDRVSGATRQSHSPRLHHNVRVLRECKGRSFGSVWHASRRRLERHRVCEARPMSGGLRVRHRVSPALLTTKRGRWSRLQVPDL
jgi:hypothetical protein